MNLLNDFLEVNRKKPFMTNILKYAKLTEIERKKVISSLITNLYIYSEQKENYPEMKIYIRELIDVLTSFEYSNNDFFVNWVEENLDLGEGNGE